METACKIDVITHTNNICNKLINYQYTLGLHVSTATGSALNQEYNYYQITFHLTDFSIFI